MIGEMMDKLGQIREAVELIKKGNVPKKAVAKEYGVTVRTIDNWINQMSDDETDGVTLDMALKIYKELPKSDREIFQTVIRYLD
jgi:transposase-like protein